MARNRFPAGAPLVSDEQALDLAKLAASSGRFASVKLPADDKKRPSATYGNTGRMQNVIADGKGGHFTVTVQVCHYPWTRSAGATNTGQAYDLGIDLDDIEL